MRFRLVPAVVATLLSWTLSQRLTAQPVAEVSVLEQESVKLKPELSGKHPRLFVNEEQLHAAQVAEKKSDWQTLYFPPDMKELKAPVLPIQLEETETSRGLIFGRLAVAYALTKESKYLERLQLWKPVMQEQKPIQIRGIGLGNADLLAGHLLASWALSYDLLKGKVDTALENSIREALIRQARQTYADMIRIKRYPFEQNHFSIPVSGLLIASLALLDEDKEAQVWAAWSRQMFVKCLDALSPDGWYFEGMNYWGFTTQFLAMGGAALEHATGEDVFRSPFFKNTPLYLAHNILPNPHFVFDFADWGPRVNQDGVSAQSGYNNPWHTLPSTVSKLVPFLATQSAPSPFLQYLSDRTTINSKALSGLLGPLYQLDNGRGKMEAPDPSACPPYHYFPEMEVVHWRADWTDPNATAIAFKSGPPGGHFMEPLLRQNPNWRPSLGHAHPDAGSFILFAKGVFLANDTGYAVKETAWHNSILVDGLGQEKGGTPFSTFKTIPYEKLNKIRMTDVWLSPRVAAGVADFAAAYGDDLGLSEMKRHLILIDGRYLVILDQMQATVPHEYEWLLHSDQAAVESAAGRFTMTNQTGRLIVQSLLPIAASNISPTIVETELYDLKKRSRPQQRGFHIALRSPKAEQARFLTAMLIQSSNENAESFHATQTNENQVELSDGNTTCSVWIGPSKYLKGEFAYLLKNNQGAILSAGLTGREFSVNDLSIKLASQGSVTLDVQAVDKWKLLEATPAQNTAVIQNNGRQQTVFVPQP